MSGESMVRVSPENPCPICHRSDWCSLSSDGALCVCMRIGDGAKKRTRNGGYLHVLREGHRPRSRRRWMRLHLAPDRPVHGEIAALAETYAAAVNPTELRNFAEELGLSGESLGRLQVGWSGDHRAWAFPMRGADMTVRGIRLRSRTGRKWAVRGGREGLFIPSGLTCAEQLLISEGPTDCAALLDLGFGAVGRPSCMGGVRLIVELVTVRRHPAVVIVADADEHGERGAEGLARALLPYAASVCVICPPEGIKDARAWKKAGTTYEDVTAVIEAAAKGSLLISTGSLATKARTVRHGS